MQFQKPCKPQAGEIKNVNRWALENEEILAYNQCITIKEEKKMKKLCVNNKDRIICISVPGRNEFYYHLVETGECIWLFDTAFSGSVFAYFRAKGCNFHGKGFSLTVKELYNFKDFKNPKLTHIIERFPRMIEYALREHFESEAARQVFDTHRIADCNLAA